MNDGVIRLRVGHDGLYRKMLELFAEGFHDRQTYLSTPPGPDYIIRLLAKEEFAALVAVRDGFVVGALVAYELVKFESERSEFYIYDLAVAETARRTGVATALIRELQGIARVRGGWVIFVQADQEEEDLPAISLYTKLGVREDVLHFDIPVE